MTRPVPDESNDILEKVIEKEWAEYAHGVHVCKDMHRFMKNCFYSGFKRGMKYERERVRDEQENDPESPTTLEEAMAGLIALKMYTRKAND